MKNIILLTTKVLSVLAYSFLAMVLSLTTLSSVSAADKALIIGLQEYRNSEANLPGIEIDVNHFKQAALRLGVAPKNIAILMNEQATEPNIKKMFARFLNDVSKDDRVYIYFSGHGSRINDIDGDESDGVDEFLVTYEFNHKTPTDGVLLDDEFNVLLTSIPSNNVIAVVDACHSGTISRGLDWVTLSNRSMGEEKGVKKFLSYPGMPSPTLSNEKDSDTSERSLFASFTNKSGAKQKSGNMNYVTISAAQDNESAIATSKGSIFTTGISVALQYALEKNEPVSPKFLYEASKYFVEQSTTLGENRFTPAISGNSALFNADLKVRPTGNIGSEWSAAESLVPARANLALLTNKKHYKVGEEISVSIDVPINGYLYLISVDQFDNTTLLFPNTLNKDNRVSQGQRFVSGESSLGFALYGAEPVGESLLVAIVRSTPIQAREMSASGRNMNGEIVDVLVSLDEHSTRAIRVGKVSNTSNSSTPSVASSGTYFGNQVVLHVAK